MLLKVLLFIFTFESDFSLIVSTGIKLCYNFFKEVIEASDLNNPSASPDVRVL